MRYDGDDTEYTADRLHRERDYGPYWYSGLWRVVRPVAVFLCALLVLYGLTTGAVRSLGRRYFLAPDPYDTDPVAFTVRSGASLTRVATDLEAQGLIRSRSFFKYYADFLGYAQKIQSGDYILKRSMTMTEVLDALTAGDGKPLTKMITVIPGWTVTDIARYLRQEELLADEGQFLALCQDQLSYDGYYYIHDILTDGSARERPYLLEGYLAPDTYEVYRTATPDDLVRRLLSQTGTVFTEAYFERIDELNRKLGLSLDMDDIVILASIIEKEAGASDFARVSAVFYNRLKAGMRLESDATVKYMTGVTRLSLNADDLATQSPYNTYRRAGLPAGPICCPSPQAVYAALYPDESFMVRGQEYLFFCTKEPESGELYFSRTLSEHEAAVRIYRPLWEKWDSEHAAKTKE